MITKEYYREYYEKNKEKLRQYNREYYAKNIEKRREQANNCYARNRFEILKRIKNRSEST